MNNPVINNSNPISSSVSSPVRMVRIPRFIAGLGVLALIIFLDALTCPILAAENGNSTSESAQETGKESTKESDKEPSKETKILQFFDTVNLSGVGDLYIEQAENQNLTVESEQNILPLVKVFVKDRTLYIDLKEASSHSEDKINYYLKVKNLKNIQSFSSSTVYIKEFEGEDLNIAINSFGEIQLKVYVNRLNIKIEGGGKVQASGVAKEQNVLITGAGEFLGNQLSGSQGLIEINGSGIANMDVAEKLSAKISKEGVLKYCGQPKIEKDLTKGAVMEPLKESECKR